MGRLPSPMEIEWVDFNPVDTPEAVYFTLALARGSDRRMALA